MPTSKIYWRKVLRATASAVVACALVTFGVSYYARELSGNFFGWPFSFYMGAQGSLICYLIIIIAYAKYMNRLDKAFGVDE
jgi:putative solute:sodium symporter small subunit